VRVDEPMAAVAVRLGRRIGVLATLRTTLEPTAALIRRKAGADRTAYNADLRVVPFLAVIHWIAVGPCEGLWAQFLDSPAAAALYPQSAPSSRSGLA
jgi:hypothetical protein